MDHTSQASPTSTTETSKISASKDKNCPFCGQAFTSSSLGRHLDLYIKPKNPKAPDGLHNVEEIRKMRQNITRRQARISHHNSNSGAASRDSSTPTTASKPPSPTAMTMHLPVPMAAYLNGVPSDGFRRTLNYADWHATGVINNLPPRPSSTAPTPELRRELSRHQQMKVDHEQRERLMEEKERNKAVEMALREVLGTIKAAKAKDNHLFDFNPYGLNFPGLCLHILSAPPTLFTTTPFHNHDTWTLGPPGQNQLSALHRHIQARARVMQQQQENQINGSCDATKASAQVVLEQDVRKLVNHVQETYNHWLSLSERQRQEYWQLEILRAFSRERGTSQETQAKLDEARLEVSRLRAQISRLNGQQQGRSHGYQPPSLSPLPSYLIDDAALSMTGSWDYDSLVQKWRDWVRTARYANGGMTNQQMMLSGIASSAYSNMQRPSGSPHVNGHVSNVSSLTPPPTLNAERRSCGRDDNPVRNSIDPEIQDVEEGEEEDMDADGDADPDADGDEEEDVDPTPAHGSNGHYPQRGPQTWHTPSRPRAEDDGGGGGLHAPNIVMNYQTIPTSNSMDADCKINMSTSNHGHGVLSELA